MAVSVAKVSVAIGSEELAWVRQRAKRTGKSVSAVLTEAASLMRAEEKRRAERDRAWAELSAWVLDGQELRDDEREEARRVLDGTAGTARRRGRAARRVA